MAVMRQSLAAHLGAIDQPSPTFKGLGVRRHGRSKCCAFVYQNRVSGNADMAISEFGSTRRLDVAPHRRLLRRDHRLCPPSSMVQHVLPRHGHGWLFANRRGAGERYFLITGWAIR
jgi:hypothetical protein